MYDALIVALSERTPQLSNYVNRLGDHLFRMRLRFPKTPPPLDKWSPRSLMYQGRSASASQSRSRTTDLCRTTPPDRIDTSRRNRSRDFGVTASRNWR